MNIAIYISDLLLTYVSFPWTRIITCPNQINISSASFCDSGTYIPVSRPTTFGSRYSCIRHWSNFGENINPVPNCDAMLNVVNDICQNKTLCELRASDSAFGSCATDNHNYSLLIEYECIGKYYYTDDIINKMIHNPHAKTNKCHSKKKTTPTAI